ncbi:hypothetical protein, partial [Vibrio cholerae]|uniref:hypothetical protein n=1 Tax=Vibrio cholerae TaxID=666 RepID=UPI00215CE89D
LESSKSKLNRSEKSAFSIQLAQVGFCVFLDADLVERVESSVVSKSLKTIKPRCFNVVGCSTRKVWFHKKQHHRCDLAFFVADS